MLMAALAAMILSAGEAAAAADLARSIAAQPPPMGWSSWNSFSNTIDSQIVMEQAKAMVATGMQKAGYQYINIDEGWWLGKRDGDGDFVVDEKAWPALAAGEKPGDMANIVHFIHSLGLKAGIYTDAGRDGCSMFPDLGPKYFNTGSEGHYEQDFLQFAKWGFDYVKVDWCGGDKENLDPAVQYAEIARAIAKAQKATGHQLYLSLCGDIVDPIVASGEHRDRKAGFDKMLANFDQGIHPEAQHTGFYNDPDMMVLGMPGFSDQQNRVHMSLWAMSGAPLLVGADLAKLSAETLATLTNAAVLAVDQDALGLQVVKVAEPAKGLQVWVKPLLDEGAKAVLLLNRTGAEAGVTASWKELGLAEDTSATVKDLWSGKDLGSFKGSYSAQVAAGDALLLVVKGKEAPLTTYRPEHEGQVEGKGMGLCHGCELTFGHVTSPATWARIRISYKNPYNTTRYAALRVNGQVATRIAFPPTGAEPGSVSMMALLDRSGAANVLNFAAGHDLAPVIESITVE